MWIKKNKTRFGDRGDKKRLKSIVIKEKQGKCNVILRVEKRKSRRSVSTSFFGPRPKRK